MSVRRPIFLPLVPLYAAGLAWKNRAFDRHPERALRLQDPVISIGSISAGGAGKTPFVIGLGEALRRAGLRFDVLSRGHGRSTPEPLRVQPAGEATDFGDEPLMLARQLACPVYVAPQRFRAGQMAEADRIRSAEKIRSSVHLLDDGFQHRQLARAVDIVLFTLEDASDGLLPAGNLREPLRALLRANVLVLREEEAEALRPVLARVFGSSPVPPVWIIERQFAMVEGPPLQKPLAFCGIARPGSFRASLHRLHVQSADFVALRDHQRYDPALIAKLIARAQSVHADGFVTTEKDAVKLTPAMRRKLEQTRPLAVVDLRVQLRDEQNCIAQLNDLLRQRVHRAS